MLSQPATLRIAIALTGLGCLQAFGDLTGLLPAKALGAASHASPAPKVFTAHEGLETFSARFLIGYRDASGNLRSLELTPAVNKKLRGPYNRRNTFGAAIAGAPLLQGSDLLRPMHNAMLHHAFCRERNLLTELGVTNLQGPFTLDIVLARAPQSPREWQLHYEVTCDVR
jgi:hypothetical protein